MSTNDYIAMIKDPIVAERVKYHFSTKQSKDEIWQSEVQGYRKIVQRIEEGFDGYSWYRDEEWKVGQRELLHKNEILSSASWMLKENEYITWVHYEREEVEGVIEFIGKLRGYYYYKVTIVNDLTESDERKIKAVTF